MRLFRARLALVLALGILSGCGGEGDLREGGGPDPDAEPVYTPPDFEKLQKEHGKNMIDASAKKSSDKSSGAGPGMAQGVAGRVSAPGSGMAPGMSPTKK
jgi:hypothetical protein